MKYRAIIHIMPRPEILDPQGKATQQGLHNLGFSSAEEVRVGRRVAMTLEANSQEEAEKQANEASKKLLANLITEVYHFEVTAL